MTIGWTDTHSNAADGLTKFLYPNPVLRGILSTGQANFCPPGTGMDHTLEDEVGTSPTLDQEADLVLMNISRAPVFQGLSYCQGE